MEKKHVVKSRYFSWKKTIVFFNEIGFETQFGRLPIELLRIIFKYKIIHEFIEKKRLRREQSEKRSGYLKCTLYIKNHIGGGYYAQWNEYTKSWDLMSKEYIKRGLGK